MACRNAACDQLLDLRIENKMNGPQPKVQSVLNQIHVARPYARDDVERKPIRARRTRCAYSCHHGASRRGSGGRALGAQEKVCPRRLQPTGEEQSATNNRRMVVQVFTISISRYLLEDEEWKYDVIPEIGAGKNVADFVDPDILERLDALERGEERFEAEGFYDDLEGEGEEDEDEETLALRGAAEVIEAREAAAHAASQHKKKNKNRRVIPRKLQNRTLG
ncbi:Nucleolar GTP-binding protein 1 [Tilletia horrida]|nr:Nucleolar GTP-binding protein 1 [Tilletia horrida]